MIDGHDDSSINSSAEASEHISTSSTHDQAPAPLVDGPFLSEKSQDDHIPFDRNPKYSPEMHNDRQPIISDPADENQFGNAMLLLQLPEISTVLPSKEVQLQAPVGTSQAPALMTVAKKFKRIQRLRFI
jgi:hypothetical protein